MKSSLRAAIGLFSFSERIKLYTALFYLKAGRKLPADLSTLFFICNDYVKLIERGIQFSKVNNDLLKAALKVREKDVEVVLRKHASDYKVLDSVLLQEEYKAAVDYLQTSFKGTSPCIIDAGGNIGLTSLYLHCFFPSAQFVVIEPDDRNAAVLQQNLSANNIQQVQLLKKALWTKTEQLVIEDSFRDGKEWSLTVDVVKPSHASAQTHTIEGVTVQEIFLSTGWPRINLLKIDIEGAERFLFTDQVFLAQMERVDAVIIEIHDEFQIRETIEAAMQELGFSAANFGDVTLFTKK